MEEKKVSKSVLKRLPGYLAYLKNMPENAPVHISATALANALGMGEVQVRKDLAMVSDGGRPKIGYLRETLIDDIEQFLGYDNTTDAVLIGAGKLGQALMGYSGFDEYGLNILAAFDASPKAEKTEEGKPIYHISQLAHFCRTHKVLMGIITVPAEAAQQVADQLIAGGIKGIWNFAPPIWMCRPTFWCSMRTWRRPSRCCPCICRHRSRKKRKSGNNRKKSAPRFKRRGVCLSVRYG